MSARRKALAAVVRVFSRELGRDDAANRNALAAWARENRKDFP